MKLRTENEKISEMLKSSEHLEKNDKVAWVSFPGLKIINIITWLKNTCQTELVEYFLETGGNMQAIY